MKTANIILIAFVSAAWSATIKAQYIEYDQELARQYRQTLVSGRELTYPPGGGKVKAGRQWCFRHVSASGWDGQNGEHRAVNWTSINRRRNEANAPDLSVQAGHETNPGVSSDFCPASEILKRNSKRYT